MRPFHLTYGKLLLTFVATAFLWPALVQGQAASTLRPAPNRTIQGDETLVLMTYEVNDLVLNVPDYPYESGGGTSRIGLGGFGGGGFGGGTSNYGSGGFFSVPNTQMMGEGFGGGANAAQDDTTTSRITMMDLTRVIAAVIAPESWSDNGNGPGVLQVLGTSLVVRQTNDVHKQIQTLLDQLRQGSGKRKTVAIDARWLLLNSDDLEKLSAAGSERNSVDRKVLAEYTRRPSSMRGLTNCFTGQLVYLVSGTRQTVVTSFVPVVGSRGTPEDFGAQFASRKATTTSMFAAQGGRHGIGDEGMGGPTLVETGDRGVGYQPVVQTPNFGTLLEIRPTLIPGGDTAIVDLKSTITVRGESATNSTFPSRQATNVPAVDRLAIDTQELATTLCVPLGRPVLVGGLTYVAPSTLALAPVAANAAPNAPARVNEIPQLYLILELQYGIDK